MRRRELLAAFAAGAAAGPPSSAAAQPKVLRLAFNTPETGFDPAQISDLNSAAVANHIFESPLAYDYLARPVRLRPRTALALPEVSADFKTLTFRIRPGITFADDAAFKGKRRELTAHDHVYAIKRFYDPRWKAENIYFFENAGLLGLTELREAALLGKRPFDYDREVEGVRAIDRYTLQVKTADANPRLPHLFADPTLAGAVAREVVEAYGDDFPAHPVGTGPYRLSKWRRASRIELERNPGFREQLFEGEAPADDPDAQLIAAALAGRRLPICDRIQIDIVEEAQPRWLAFLNREHDLILVPATLNALAVQHGRLAPFLQRRDIRLQRSLRPTITITFFNFAHPLVGGYMPERVALRRAVALAYNGPEDLRLLRGDQAVPAESIVPPFTSGFDPDYRSEMSEYDPARAKALLDMHGFVDRDGDGFREQPDGQPLVLRLASLSSQVERLGNELWKKCLDAIGLKIEFDIATWPVLLKKSRANQLMMWSLSWAAAAPDGGFFLGLGYGPNADTSNDARFALPEFDRLFERQKVLPDGPQRDALMREAKNLLVAYMPYKVHVHSVANDLQHPWVKHYRRHPFATGIWGYVDVER